MFLLAEPSILSRSSRLGRKPMVIDSPRCTRRRVFGSIPSRARRVRTRKEPNANVVDGHYGAMACHMGNMAYREMRRITWQTKWDV